MADVKTYKCFPTLIHKFVLDIPTDDKILMTKYIETFKGVDEIQNPLLITHTEDDLHTMSYFRNLKDNILKLNKTILDDLDYEYEDLIITNMWANIMSSGGSHPPHTHSNNFLSGVFYLKTDTDSSPILFFDPRPQANVIVPRKKENNWENSNIAMFNPTENTGLIFPSWLQHFVPTSKGERISISWNILIKGHYGEPNTLQNAYI
jgi:uncharacterized protein (TIGR02466 family)